MQVKGELCRDLEREAQWVWLTFRVRCQLPKPKCDVPGGELILTCQGNMLSFHGKKNSIFSLELKRSSLGLNLKGKISCGTSD